MYITKDNSSLHKIRDCLPQTVSSALSRLEKSTLDKISEIRLRRNGITSITIDGNNHILSVKGLTYETSFAIKCTRCDIEDFLYKFCKGSVYTHEKTILQSFIVRDGIRVGLGNTDSVGIPSSINVRLARHIPGCSETLMHHICENGFTDSKGILIISSPGIGKTTLLRDLAVNLSTNNYGKIRRVCVIDERNEIFMENVFENCCVDFISGLGKCEGIERATRLLSPQVIICDEISGSDEANKITLQQNSGVIFIASFHADSVNSALNKEYIRKMFDDGVFSHIFLLERNGSKISFSLTEFKNA